LGRPFVTPARGLAPYQRARLGQHQGAYYVRLSVYDRPGAMASIAQRMADQDVSLESIVQRRPRHQLPGTGVRPELGSPTSLVLITHETTEAAMRAALDAIEKDGKIAHAPQMIRIEQLA
jgi:homoserine dehydrogenase